jgi:hypothetical protein
MDSRHAQDVAQEVLLDRLPEGYMLVDSGFDLGEVAEEDVGPGAYTVFVTAKGYAAVSLDREQAIDLVRGQRITEAQERLMASFPLAEVPRMEVWPESMERMPQLPIRISVRVLPQGASEAQSASMAP